ncbi:MAG: preprotein translocase subunit YajC [Spirochaetae bacterium HGW-Spirochaetae-5]|nr:MAG: preprotein translocase subunit YajC [Spirochaetae bacterium HGW-Spirochaetae-5]
MFGTAYAQGQGAAGSGSWMSFVPIVLMIVIFYFLLIRPQQKKEKQRLAMINSLKNGDKIITVSGIYGVVAGIKDDIITVKIASSTNVEIAKSAVQAKIS